VVEILSRIEAKATSPPPPQPLPPSGPKVNDEIYLHLQYHPNDIPRRQLQSIYDEHLAYHFKNTLDIKRSIIA